MSDNIRDFLVTLSDGRSLQISEDIDPDRHTFAGFRQIVHDIIAKTLGEPLPDGVAITGIADMGESSTTNSRPSDDEGPPDPGDFEAFRKWLESQPREWSVVIAARAAMRVAPLVVRREYLKGTILSVFRAIAIARFAAKYPDRAIEAPAARAAAFASAASLHAFVETYIDADDDEFRASASVVAEASANAARTSAISASAFPSRAASTAADTVRDAGIGAARAADADDAETTLYESVQFDARQLQDNAVSPEQLAVAQLWPTTAPPVFSDAWESLSRELRAQGPHWEIWISWYSHSIVRGAVRDNSEAEHAVFTDAEGGYPWKDKLPWSDGAEAVNTAIARRLELLVPAALTAVTKPERVAQLAELASPQPLINASGQLDASTNKPFDVPEDDGDLAELPFRQRNLVKNMLRDLPANAPKHLKDFLRSYDDELKARGTQPMLGVLKDDADIIAAAVAAPRAEDEWLEAGMRKAFDRFAENHRRIINHYPLDPKREEAYAATEVDEARVSMQTLETPLAELAAKTEHAHQSGTVTDDFKAAVDNMHDVSRVIATLPPSRAPEIKISPEDRFAPISTKKRFIVRVVGFLKKATDQVNDQNFGRTANALAIGEALRQALEKLLPFIK